MKYKLLVLVIFALRGTICFSQAPPPLVKQNAGGSPNVVSEFQGGVRGKLYSFFAVKDTLNNAAVSIVGAVTVRPQDTVGNINPVVYISNGKYWDRMSGGGGIDTTALHTVVQATGQPYADWKTKSGIGGVTYRVHFNGSAATGNTDNTALHLVEQATGQPFADWKTSAEPDATTYRVHFNGSGGGSGMPYTASNGLSMVGNNTVIGGSLTGNTVIEQGGYNFELKGLPGHSFANTPTESLFIHGDESLLSTGALTVFWATKNAFVLEGSTYGARDSIAYYARSQIVSGSDTKELAYIGSHVPTSNSFDNPAPAYSPDYTSFASVSREGFGYTGLIKLYGKTLQIEGDSINITPSRFPTGAGYVLTDLLGNGKLSMRPVGEGSSYRFGIEDNTSSVPRNMNMGYHSFAVDAASIIDLTVSDIPNARFGHLYMSPNSISIGQIDNSNTLTQRFVNPVSKTGDYHIPLTVNGVAADDTGNVQISTQDANEIRTEKVTISSAQLLNMGTTAVELVPAQGAGKTVIAINAVMNYTHNGVSYTGNTGLYVGDNLSSPAMFTGIISSSVSRTTVLYPSDQDYSSVHPDNLPLIIKTISGAPASGNGTLDVYITYIVVTL